MTLYRCAYQQSNALAKNFGDESTTPKIEASLEEERSPMKFELTNMRLQVSDENLLNDMRNVANRLGKRSLKQRDYSKKRWRAIQPKNCFEEIW